jgi:gas vesicle protein
MLMIVRNRREKDFANGDAMNKWTSALIGAAAGAAVSAVYLYLFAPARGTTFDENYQSRLDWALAEGEKAGIERKQELLRELEQARQSPSASITDEASLQKSEE